MNEIEIKKDLYKSKAMAKFSHYKAGELFYNVELIDGIYQFPISTVENKETEVLYEVKVVSNNIDNEKVTKQAEPITI